MFLFYAFRSARQAARAPGNLATRLLNDRDWAFWTATAWTNDAAMKQFMISGVHGRAMRKLMHWCDEAFLVHWTQEQDALPSWPEAHARLQSEGRRSKVNHPSPAHIALRFPEPRLSSRGDVRIK